LCSRQECEYILNGYKYNNKKTSHTLHVAYFSLLINFLIK